MGRSRKLPVSPPMPTVSQTLRRGGFQWLQHARSPIRRRAGFERDKPAILDLKDPIAMLQSARPVRDDDRRSAMHESLHRIHYAAFGLHIQRTRRLIQDENGRVLEERAGQ